MNKTWLWLKKLFGVEHLDDEEAIKFIASDSHDNIFGVKPIPPNNDFNELDKELNEIKESKKRTQKFDSILLRDGFTRNQSNTSSLITESKNNLTREQLKIFYQCVTLIDSIKDKDLNYYTISVKDFCEKLGFSKDNRSWLINELRKMLRQVFEIETPNGDYIGYTIFSSLRYRNAEQQIDIRFNNEMKPFLLELHKNFTKIEQVKYINSFSSKYAIRFYAFLKDYRLMSHRDFTIKDLIIKLKLPKSYINNYNNFYIKVLKPTIDDINQHSDLWVKNPQIIEKQGKKVLKFRLEFGNKATQLAEDFCIILQEKFKKYNDFRMFYGQWWLGTLINQPVKITDISVNYGNYYQLFCDNSCVYQTPNKQEMINKIINGIYRGIKWKYENEKQAFMGVIEWQTAKNELESFKSYFNTMQKKYKTNIKASHP